MIESFKSINELFTRIRPALTCRLREYKRLGVSDIKDIDIWNFLVHSRWKISNNLMLCDIVSDIFNTHIDDIRTYLDNRS